MNESVTSREAVSAARHRGHDARLLADSLRSSRVTLLYGEGNVSRTDLLTDGVLPLLRRRAGDGPSRGGRRARAAAPDAERRTVPEGRQRRSERVVLFNDWGGAPLAALEVSILSSLPMGVVVQSQNHRLPDLLAELSDRLDAQFLILFDAFEELWGPGSRADAVVEFLDQLSEAANRKNLHANFLLSIDESAEPRLEALRNRITGFDDSTLRLRAEAPRQVKPELVELVVPEIQLRPLPINRPPLLPLADSLPATVRPERVRRKRPPREALPPPEPIKTETVYALIESTLTQTAGTVEPWHDPEASASAPQPPGAGLAREVPLQEREGIGSPLPTRREESPGRERSLPGQLAGGSAAPIQPPSPIDEWLDAATAWLRRAFKRR